MTDDRSAATEREQVLLYEIDNQARNLAKSILDYMLEVKSTGHAPQPPPRPKHDVIARAIEALQMLDLFIRGMGDPQKK